MSAAPTRYRVGFIGLLTFCNTCLYLARANMSMAVVFMYTPGSTAASAVLAGFFFGYPALQMFAGSLAARYGPKRLLCWAVFLWSLVSMLIIPLYHLDGQRGDETHFPLGVFLARVFIGICEGMNFPAQTALISSWVPQQERSRAWAWSFAGEPIGNILAMLVCPLLATALGWQSIFYFSAVLGLVWLRFFTFFASDTVRSRAGWLARNMSEAEKQWVLQQNFSEQTTTSGTTGRELVPKAATALIDADATSSVDSGSTRDSTTTPAVRGNFGSEGGFLGDAGDMIITTTTTATGTNLRQPPVPWKKILTNVPFIVNWFAHTCYNWGWYLVISVMPSFYEERFHVPYAQLGFLSVAPYIALILCTGPIGFLADYCVSSRLLTCTAVRRIWTAIANGGCSVCFVVLALLSATSPELRTTSVTTNVAGISTRIRPLETTTAAEITDRVNIKSVPSLLSSTADVHLDPHSIPPSASAAAAPTVSTSWRLGETAGVETRGRENNVESWFLKKEVQKKEEQEITDETQEVLPHWGPASRGTATTSSTVNSQSKSTESITKKIVPHSEADADVDENKTQDQFGVAFTALHCCVLICLMTALGAFTFPGFIAGYTDLSPNQYDAHLMSIGNAIAATSGVFGNWSVALLDNNFYTIFLLSAAVQWVGLLPYVCFAQGKDQRF
ncbi:unnamed protein product [Amoebophrya sp. A120]|nr:unnamed protein product [Amoebophrya sp. A120]|eukprot:GSA120T00023403001.1